MAQRHNIDYAEKPMTREGRIQGPSRRYRRLRHPNFPAAEWTAQNPLLQRGEIGVEIDTHRMKVGDGYTLWNDLAYASEGASWGEIIGTISDQTDLTTYVANAVSAEATLRENADTGLQNQITANKSTMDNHIDNTSNPHSVTAAQVGLGNVDNTSDLNKPISTATQAALNNKQDVISDLATIRSDASAGKSASDTIATYGDIVTYSASDFATAAQGALADTAVQPVDLATVATSGQYSDLSGTPTIPTTLASLTGDVSISSPSNGEHLVYNGTSQKWENTAGAATVSWGDITGSLSNQTDLQNALNDKVDKGHQVIEFQAPTAENNHTWYRKYADGWVEQGGVRNVSAFSLGSGSTTNLSAFTFPVPLASTPTDIYIGDNMSFFNCHHYNVTATGMQIKVSSQLPVSYTQAACEINWRVSGMIAS